MIRRCLSILRLALPVLISQVGLILVSFADNIMVGRYSTEALASASFVINLFNIPMLCAMGFSYGLTPLIGLLFSQGKAERIGQTLRAGVIANLIAGLLLTAIMGALYNYIPRMGQPEELLPLIRPYYLIFLSSILPMTLFNAFAQWSYAVRNTSMPMWILLACNLGNILGNYALIFGNWGCPELGLTGAGLSTLGARIVAPLAIIIIFLKGSAGAPYRDAFLRKPAPGVVSKDIRNVAATSWPVALQMTFETSAFSLCAVMAGWIGKVPLAAFQIIVVVGTLGFCIYYSIGTAIAVLVSNARGYLAPDGSGKGDAPSAEAMCRRVAFDGYAVMLCFAALSSLIFIFFSKQLMGAFTTDTAVLSVAYTLVFPLVLYQLGDATQVTFANALRGTSHVMPMLWIAFVSYVVFGLTSTWILAFPCGLGVYGIVLSFSVSLFMAAALFLNSFLRVTRN